MKVCDMCLEEYKGQRDFNTEFIMSFDPFNKGKYLLCANCKDKIRKYIKFERARAEK